MAQIQFSRGVSETVIPDIRLTRGKKGDSGTATFRFDSPKIFDAQSTDDITGMYLVDEEGEIVTNEVKGKFVNGKPTSVESDQGRGGFSTLRSEMKIIPMSV